MSYKKYLIATGASLGIVFSTAANAHRVIKLTDCIDLDLYNILPECFAGSPMALDAPAKDATYCNDMYIAHSAYSEDLRSFAETYNELYEHLENMPPTHTVNMSDEMIDQIIEIARASQQREENEAAERLAKRCHEYQTDYLGKGITVTIVPGEFRP